MEAWMRLRWEDMVGLKGQRRRAGGRRERGSAEEPGRFVRIGEWRGSRMRL